MAEETDKKEESQPQPEGEEEGEVSIDCSDILNNKVMIINVSEDGKIIANLYDLSQPPAPEGDQPNNSQSGIPKIGKENEKEEKSSIPKIGKEKAEKSSIPKIEKEKAEKSSIPKIGGGPEDTSGESNEESKEGSKEESKEESKEGADTPGAPPPPPAPVDRNAQLTKALSEVMREVKNPNWIPRVFWLKQQKKGKFNVVLHEQSVLELITGSEVSLSDSKGPLSKMACSGLDPSNHTDVLSLLLGFPVVPPDKYRDQLIGDIIKSVNPIKSIPEGKDLPQLQEHSRKKLESIKKLCEKLLASTKSNAEFANVTRKINKLITPKTKDESSGGGKRKKTRKRFKQ